MFADASSSRLLTYRRRAVHSTGRPHACAHQCAYATYAGMHGARHLTRNVSAGASELEGTTQLNCHRSITCERTVAQKKGSQIRLQCL